MKKLCLSESGRLIPNIMEICYGENITGYLVTVDLQIIERFASLDLEFLIRAFKNMVLLVNFLTRLRYCYIISNHVLKMELLLLSILH